MTTAKHTPGPWTIRVLKGLAIPGQRAFAIDFNEDQEQVVDLVYEEADAYLIAAAPEMLDALEKLVILAGDRLSIPETYAMRDLLAAAKGESK